METQKIVVRLSALIAMGEKVLSTRHSPPAHIMSDDYVDDAMFRQWRTSSLAFLRMMPSDFVYYSEFEPNCRVAYYGHAQEGVAILKAAKEDIEGGHLQKVETLVSAEMFTDFLDMAEHLLENGYHHPAASLIGAVLEDGLRRICSNNRIGVKKDDNISSLNQKLADNKIYTRLQQGEIQNWNKLRDSADHGRFNEYTSDNVKKMMSEVRTFLVSYLK